MGEYGGGDTMRKVQNKVIRRHTEIPSWVSWHTHSHSQAICNLLPKSPEAVQRPKLTIGGHVDTWRGRSCQPTASQVVPEEWVPDGMGVTKICHIFKLPRSVTDSSSCVALKLSSMFGQGCAPHRLLPAKTERSRHREAGLLLDAGVLRDVNGSRTPCQHC